MSQESGETYSLKAAAKAEVLQAAKLPAQNLHVLAAAAVNKLFKF